MARKDPFQTLDDPAPAGAVTQAGSVNEAQIAAGSLGLGQWRSPDGRPGWVRRFLVWLVLGWKWTR